MNDPERKRDPEIQDAIALGYMILLDNFTNYGIPLEKLYKAFITCVISTGTDRNKTEQDMITDFHRFYEDFTYMMNKNKSDNEYIKKAADLASKSREING